MIKVQQSRLTQGSILKSLVLFSLPMILSNTINLLFHAADVAVLAYFADGSAVAAVGACGSLITLMVSLFTGLSTGASVLIAKRVGENNRQGTTRAIGTALTIAVLSGLFLMTVSLLFSRRFLILMNCQPDVLDMAVLYMKIYFLGSPIMMLNTFATAALIATGDSTHPMFYSSLSGVINVAANVFFVKICNLQVAGVAIATVGSAAVSVVLVLTRLFGKRGRGMLDLRSLGINRNDLFDIIKVGVPTCLCSLSFFSANVILASAVNSISTDAMTANSISGQFDGFIYTIGAAIASATSVMVAQNYGARRFSRIRKTIRVSVVYVTTVSITLGMLFVILAEPLLRILSDSDSVIAIAKDRMTLLCLTYFVTSIMEVFSFSLRAIKRQKSTMVVGAVCGFGIRCLWRFFVWPLRPTLSVLFACYAVSALAAIVIYVFVYRNALKSFNQDLAA